MVYLIYLSALITTIIKSQLITRIWKIRVKTNLSLQKLKLLVSQVFGQKVGDKFTKLSKLGFSMEYFTADFLQFFTKNCQSLAFGLVAGYLPTNPSISWLFSKLPNFLSIFFSCVGIGPPAAKMPWGYLSGKKNYIQDQKNYVQLYATQSNICMIIWLSNHICMNLIALKGYHSELPRYHEEGLSCNK